MDPRRSERAKAGPFGGPIAHGYLTLSLGPICWHQVIHVDGIKMGVNYGPNKVRFPAPVPVGSKLRVGAALVEVEDIPGGCADHHGHDLRGRRPGQAVLRGPRGVPLLHVTFPHSTVRAVRSKGKG